MFNHLLFLDRVNEEIEKKVGVSLKEQGINANRGHINELIEYHTEELVKFLVDKYFSERK